jgi:hypothetical protein
MSMVQPEAAPETEVVTGVVTGIVDKGGDKWQVSVKTDPSSQYSRNLWTKDYDLVHQLSALIGSAMTFQCGISHWTNQQNQPVRSLWINGVGPAQQFSGAVPQAQPGTQAVAQAMHPQQVFQPQPGQQTYPVVQPQMQPVTQEQVLAAHPQAQAAWDDDPKQAKIHRQTASKVAGILIGYLPPEERTLDTLLTVAERLVAYYDNGMEVVPANDAGEFPPGW